MMLFINERKLGMSRDFVYASIFALGLMCGLLLAVSIQALM